MPYHGYGDDRSYSSDYGYGRHGSYKGGDDTDWDLIDDATLEKEAKKLLFFFFGLIITSLILAALVGLLLSYIGPPIRGYLQSLLSFMSAKVLSTSLAVLGALLVPTAGYLLYALRKRAKSLYGAIEIVFGVLLAYYTIRSTIGDAVTLATVSSSQMVVTFTALLSSVYIVVRGLDNISQVRQKRLEAKRLINAVESGDEETTRWLIQSGVSPDVADKAGDTPLMLAIRKEHIAIIEYLLTRRTDVHKMNKREEFASDLVERTTNEEIKALFRTRSRIANDPR